MNLSHQSLILFLHIPKAGGTTLRSVIGRQYAKNEVLTVPPLILKSKIDKLYLQEYVNQFGNFSEYQNHEIKIVRGHMVFGVHQFILRPCIYITMLRHPIERVISTYAYMLKAFPEYMLREKHIGIGGRVNSNNKNPYISIEEFMHSDIKLHSAKFDLDNGQTRRLAGLSSEFEDAEFGCCSKEMLTTAKNNLNRFFPVFGVMEEFDKSMILFKRYFQWKAPFYQRLNVSQGSLDNHRSKISEEAYKYIEKYNQFDLELYKYAKELFESKFSDIGHSIENEFKVFKLINPTYGKLVSITSFASRFFN